MTNPILGPARIAHLFSGRWLVSLCCALGMATTAAGQRLEGQAIVHKVQGSNERLEMVVNTSRILQLDEKVPQVQSANPDVIQLTPLSASKVQLLAKKAGVTQVNLWDEREQIHTIDVIVFADTRELSMLLRQQFPTTSLKVVPTANSVIISGHVDDANQISRIVEIAKQFYPEVINNITVAGVQQVLLKVKVLEVARTKLRKLGIDLRASGTHNANFVQTGVSSLLNFSATQTPGGFGPQAVIAPAPDALQLSFGVLTPDSPFFGFLNALQKDQLASVLAEPNLVAYSGRPARFNSGGEFPITVPQSLGTISVQFKPYGTQVEFVPIVLGDGAIRLEVYPRVSEIDDSRSVSVNGINVPALKVREANTGVEMRAGQTLAIAGLVQQSRTYESRKIPWLGELPYIGALFRNMRGEDTEVELLLLVTPELVGPLEPCEVPTGGPGLSTSSPNDKQFYLKGHIEVPRCAVDDACAPARSPGTVYEYGRPQGSGSGMMMMSSESSSGEVVAPSGGTRSGPDLNSSTQRGAIDPRTGGAARVATAPTTPLGRPADRSMWTTTSGQAGAARPNAQNPPKRPAAPVPRASTAAPGSAAPGFIGPVGYDVKR